MEGGGGSGGVVAEVYMQEPLGFRGFPGVLLWVPLFSPGVSGSVPRSFHLMGMGRQEVRKREKRDSARAESHPVFLFRGVNVWTDNTSRVSPRAWLRAPACFRWQTTRLPQTLQVSQVLVRRVPHPFHVTAGGAGRLAEQHFPKGPAEI